MAQLRQRGDILRETFGAIDMLDFKPSYDECVDSAERFLREFE